MKNILQASLLASVAALALWPSAVSAQGKCTEGVALNGECVDPAIANAMRQAAIIFSQPKISFTAYPVLPTGDNLYRYPNQLDPNQQLPSATGTPPPPPSQLP